MSREVGATGPGGRLATSWSRVAAAGTDARLLRCVTARLLGPRGTPRAIAREAAARGVGPGGDVRLVVRRLAPEPRGPAAGAADETAERWVELGVRAAVLGDPAYPPRLADGWPATAGPLLLAWRGPGGAIPRRPTVAIVGARRATSYGTGVAAWLAEAVADAGGIVISGGAVGVDAAAHEATLHAPGATVVMLGCGHAVDYPRKHAAPGGLFDRILEAGGWLASELPPTTRPRPSNVLARNRLVAALADVVVVVEGGPRSGSLRTAEAALDRGVPVLAVPGDVRAPGSAAPHRLLAEGAAPCLGPEDLIAALRHAVGPVGPGDTLPGAGEANQAPGRATAAVSVLPDGVRAELARRWPRPIRVGELARVTGLPAGQLLAAVTRARVAGEVAEGPEGVRLSRSPSGG